MIRFVWGPPTRGKSCQQHTMVLGSYFCVTCGAQGRWEKEARRR